MQSVNRKSFPLFYSENPHRKKNDAKTDIEVFISHLLR